MKKLRMTISVTLDDEEDLDENGDVTEEAYESYLALPVNDWDHEFGPTLFG